MALPFNEKESSVMHIDLNSCFASCEQQANPLLRGKPVAVAAYATPRGCILAASYEAKRLGVKTGMRVFEGRELCPNLIVKEPDPHMYRYVSQKLMALFREYTPDCVQKSVDEAVLDFSSVAKSHYSEPNCSHCPDDKYQISNSKYQIYNSKVKSLEAVRLPATFSREGIVSRWEACSEGRNGAGVGALHVTPLRELDSSPLPRTVRSPMYPCIDTYNKSGRAGISPLHRIGMEIKRRIKEEIGDWLTVNIGIGPNRFLAKTASSWHKPDGLDEINAQNLRFALSEFGLRDLCGINYRLEERLNLVDIFTPIDLLNADLLQLRRAFGGICGYYWHLRIRGYEIDKIDFPRRSFGQSYTLPHPTDDLIELSRLLLKLCEKMGRRLRESSFSAGGIHVACAYDGGEGWHHGEKVATTLYSTQSLYREAHRLLLSAKLSPARILWVSCFDLRSNFPVQQYLFEDLLEEKHLSDALDSINDRYGEFTVVPARMMGMQRTIVERIAFGK